MDQVNVSPRNRRLSARRHPRGRCKVTCHRGQFDLGPNLARALLDVSETGVRLVLGTDLPRRQAVLVSLEGQGHHRPVRIPGVITWSVPTAEGTFCVGVKFDKRLPYADFVRLT